MIYILTLHATLLRPDYVGRMRRVMTAVVKVQRCSTDTCLRPRPAMRKHLSIDPSSALLPCDLDSDILQTQPHAMATQDAVLQRCFAAEPIVALAASADGCHVAGGGASGHVYLWQAASGRLLRSWPAHYKVSAVMPSSKSWCDVC